MENENKKLRKAKRIIVNKSANDWNNEPEYKLQKVRVYGESKKSFIIDSYGNFKFKVHKSQVFFNKQDFKNKMDNIEGFNLTEYEKEYLLKSF